MEQKYGFPLLSVFPFLLILFVAYSASTIDGPSLCGGVMPYSPASQKEHILHIGTKW
jgi:hypothetical protein